ncbi:MAG: PAS domain S-box protein, partial [Planctomycetaceae bacterium]|nr:PAS domain S-box protein [Planctomycetaceae bacterium]
MPRNRDVNADTALERFRGYFELAPQGVFVTDVQGRCLEANPAFCRITGYSLEELAQLTISDLRPPDSPAPGLESLSALLDSGRSEGEFPFVGKTGLRRWWSVSAARLDDGQCLGFATDITDQKNAADELRLERDLRRQLLDAAPVIVLMLDLNGGILYYNPFTAALLGSPLDALRGQDWFLRCVPAADRERSRNAFQSSFAGRPTRNFRNQIVSHGGEALLIEWCDQPLRDARGEVVGMLAIGQDVTHRQRQEEALRASEHRLRQTIDACFGFIGLMELDGTLIEINQPPLEMGGLRPEDVLGKKGWETEWWSFDPAAQHRLRDAVERAARGETVRFESPVRARNDTRRHVDVAVGPLRNEHDAITGLVGFSVDVTERRRSEAELRLKDQALQQSINAIVFTDPLGQVREVNAAFLKLFGYPSPEEVLGRHAAAFCAEPNFAAEVIDALHARGEWFGEFGAKRRDGSLFDVQMSATLLRDADGRPLMLMGSMIDITDRKLHEAALQKSEAKYRSLIEGARDMIFRMSIPDGRYEYVSPAAEQVIGYSAAELLAEPLLISRVIHPCFREFFEREWDKVCRGIVEPYFEYCVLDRQDNTLWISQSTVGVLDDSGAIIAIEGVCRNVTEFKQAEQQLRDNEMRLQAILDSTPDCVKVVDSDCRLLEINRAGLRMFEVDSVEVLRGRDISIGLPPEYRVAFRQGIADACAGTQTRVEYEAVGRNGARLWLEQYAVGLPPTGLPDQSPQVLSVARDITERRRIENALRASEETYRTLFNLMTEGMSLHEIILDDDGRPIDYTYLDVNPAFERLLGERRDAVVGRRQSEHRSADTEFWIQRYGEVALTGQPLRLEYVNPESGRHWMVFAYRTAPKQFAVLFSETTEWRRAERAMQETQSRLMMVLNNAPVIVFSFGPDSVLTLSEGKGLAALGLKPGELVGTSLLEFNAHSPQAVEGIREALSGKTVTQLFEGPDLAFEMLYQPLFNAEGAVESVSGVAIDCTDRMLARKALHESEERLRILVQCAPAGVAMLDHNLRYMAHSRRWLTDYQLGDRDLI